MGLSNANYAKYQFMLLVLKVLWVLIIQTYDPAKHNEYAGLLRDITAHEEFIQDLMKEE